MEEQKKTRRRNPRPMKLMSFRFDERLYNQFLDKAEENNMSCVQALEHLMNIAVKGILELKTPAASYEQEELTFELAGHLDEIQMLEKFVAFVDSEPGFIPSKEKMEKWISKGKPVVIRFPKFRVEFSDSEMVMIENNKVKAVITDFSKVKEMFGLVCGRIGA